MAGHDRTTLCNSTDHCYLIHLNIRKRTRSVVPCIKYEYKLMREDVRNVNE